MDYLDLVDQVDYLAQVVREEYLDLVVQVDYPAQVELVMYPDQLGQAADQAAHRE
jgi:hypothetical protein